MEIRVRVVDEKRWYYRPVYAALVQIARLIPRPAHPAYAAWVSLFLTRKCTRQWLLIPNRQPRLLRANAARPATP